MHDQPAPESQHVRHQLLADHRSLESVFEQLLAAFAADDRERIQALWTTFESTLSRHLAAEEKFLVPVLARTNPRQARAILAEHRQIRARMLELGTALDLHLVRLETARAFIDELRAHARHEDEVLYRLADDDLDEQERASLLAALVGAVRDELGLKRTG